MRIEASFLDRMMRERAPALYFTTLTFPQYQRDGLRALYAFFRICRDTIDQSATKQEATFAASRLLRLLENASSDRHAVAQPVVDQVIDESPDLGLAWEAWCALEEEFGVPRAYALEFARGLQLEADGARPESTEDLLRYSYRTGGVVGLMILHVLQLDPALQQAAVDAASAARLTSLSRGIYRHFTLGRIFVPTSWMSYSTTRVFSPAWADQASKRFDTFANVMYASARQVFPELPWKTRLMLATALVLHRESRNRWWRKFDRTADELIRQTASLARETYERLRKKSRNDATKPKMISNPTATVRDFDTVWRNQNMLISRDLPKERASQENAP